MKAAMIAALALVFAVTARATPVSYRIDFTRTDGTAPTPMTTIFGYDGATRQFSNFVVVWPLSAPAGPIQFNFLQGPFGVFDLNSHGPEVSTNFFRTIVDGGRFSVADAFVGNDARIDLDGISFFNLGGGYNTATSAGGTFTTTAVAEPGTLYLTLIGGFLFLGGALRYRWSSPKSSSRPMN